MEHPHALTAKCYVMLCYVALRYVMLRYVTLCYVMLSYVMLCYVMLWSDSLIPSQRCGGGGGDTGSFLSLYVPCQ